MKRVMTWEIPGVHPQIPWWRNVLAVAIMAWITGFLLMTLGEVINSTSTVHFTYLAPVLLGSFAAVLAPVLMLIGGHIVSKRNNGG